MRCEEAQQLFDAYLNGELAGSLATELGAHRVQCADCRRALALMEVSGQIIASDRDSVSLREDFSDRLLACVDSTPVSQAWRFRRRLYLAGSLAAAAVVVLALFGVFNHRETKVAGETKRGIKKPEEGFRGSGIIPEDALLDPATAPALDNQPTLQEWVDQARRNIEMKRRSGESLQQRLDLTAEQLMDLLDRADQDRRQQEQSDDAELVKPTTSSDTPSREPENPQEP